jgi:hypothetical protein
MKILAVHPEAFVGPQVRGPVGAEGPPDAGGS